MVTLDIDPSSGMALRLERVARRLSAREVAEAVGVSRQRVYEWERRARPPDTARKRYLSAVAQLDTARR